MAICDVSPPSWFPTYEQQYGCGPQGDEAGDVTQARGWLRTAGVTIRTAAWTQLVACGFRPLMASRSEDIELGLALMLAGWRIWYDPRLAIEHHVAVDRLNWAHLRRTWRGIGEASAFLEAYRFWGPGRGIRSAWQGKAAATFVRVMMLAMKRPQLLLGKPLEGDDVAIRWEATLGHLQVLLKRGRQRSQAFAEVASLRRALQCTSVAKI
jgi:hypothetical protein